MSRRGSSGQIECLCNFAMTLQRDDLILCIAYPTTCQGVQCKTLWPLKAKHASLVSFQRQRRQWPKCISHVDVLMPAEIPVSGKHSLISGSAGITRSLQRNTRLQVPPDGRLSRTGRGEMGIQKALQHQDLSRTHGCVFRRTLSGGRRARSKSDHFYSLIAGSGGVAGSVKGGPRGDAYGSEAHAVSEEARDGLVAGGNPIVKVEWKRLLAEENRKNTKAKVRSTGKQVGAIKAPKVG